MEFRFEAKSNDGVLKRGTRSGMQEAEIVSWIRDQGWRPINIMPAGDLSAGIMKAGGSQYIKGTEASDRSFLELMTVIRTRDKLIFFRQLAVMITAGIPVASALAVLAEQTANKRFKRVVEQVYKRVSAGTTLGGAMAEEPKAFGTVAIPLVISGEESGTLDQSLTAAAAFLENQEELRKKIVSALTYPSVVILIALLVFGIMVAVVIPQFEKAFSNLNIEMPAVTMLTFSFGRWMQKDWYFIPLILMLAVVSVIRLRKVPSLKLPIDSFILKIPVFGDIKFKAGCIRSFRTLGALIRSGVPILQALELTSEAAGNENIRKSFLEMRSGAAMGMPLHKIIKEKKLFPPMIAHMIAVGEETGETDEMLEKIADWYDSDLSEKVKRLSSVIEPVMVVFVGVIVGFMVLAIFLPMITAINTML